jgi:hypothetical protein
MPETNFRALCAELTEELVNEYGYCTEWEKGLPLCESNVSELLTRARAALSQPEPVAPTDEEIMEVFWEHQNGLEELWAEGWPAAARAVLAKCGHQ